MLSAKFPMCKQHACKHFLLGIKFKCVIMLMPFLGVDKRHKIVWGEKQPVHLCLATGEKGSENIRNRFKVVAAKMANRPTGYGMTAEIARKKAAKYDPEREQEAIDFITSTTGSPLPGGFQESLKDGIILCNLANALKPGSVSKINESKMAFKMMENIGKFLAVAESLGVAKMDLFQTVDLYEAQNIPGVIDGILAVKRKLTGGESTPNVRNFSEEQLKAGKGIIGLQMGSNKGASQKGMTAPGAVRQIRHEDNMDRS